MRRKGRMRLSRTALKTTTPFPCPTRGSSVKFDSYFGACDNCSVADGEDIVVSAWQFNDWASMVTSRFQQGDLVVYRKTKHSPQPGPRAQSVVPATAGDDYAYCVDKYWIVVGITPEQKLSVKTRTGKMHTLEADDPNLRRARFWERWFLGHRFPEVTPSPQSTSRPSKDASS